MLVMNKRKILLCGFSKLLVNKTYINYDYQNKKLYAAMLQRTPAKNYQLRICYMWILEQKRRICFVKGRTVYILDHVRLLTRHILCRFFSERFIYKHYLLLISTSVNHCRYYSIDISIVDRDFCKFYYYREALWVYVYK